MSKEDKAEIVIHSFGSGTSLKETKMSIADEK